jgi:hypothetical protein
VSDVTKAVRHRTPEEQMRDLKGRVRTLEAEVARLVELVAKLAGYTEQDDIDRLMRRP